MTSTDTTTTASSSFLTTLSADWQKAVSFFQVAEQDMASFLAKVASGAEIFIQDVESVGQYVGAHLGLINTAIAAVGTIASTVAPNNASVQKVIDDLNTGANDVAALGNALANGSSSGDPAIVTTAVTAIGAVKQLSQLASQAANTLTTLTANAPNATQAISPATPAQG